MGTLGKAPEGGEKPVVNTVLALLAIAGGVVTALGLWQLIHRANDPLRRVNRLLDLCYRKISKLEATLAHNERHTEEILP